ncbi:MAG: glycosyl hydrolase, partial [Chloroflexales bacterium]|nr:glycosyl hydrolase [Chloroflexales bacterium]
LRQRAWYYSHIIADPQDPDTVWVLNVETWRSIDGGKTFQKAPVPHGDNHELWIDPHNPQRMVMGNDGGATVSFNGGLSWSSLYNQPTSEFYHLTVDSRMPYRVYGAQQDNTTMSVPSRSNSDAITTVEWREIGGGESGYIAVRPDNPNIVYAGSFQGYLTRYDYESGQLRNIMVWPEHFSGWGAKDQKYRFAWTSPTLLSPHDPNVLYTAGNMIFRSTDEGGTWQAMSPDLSRNDPQTLEPSGGPITKDNTGAEVYGTVFTLAESPLVRGLLWAGSDDGMVHLSRDGGQTWTKITPPDLPEWALISIIEASPHDPATAYLAVTRYKLDDFQPYLYKTSDYGATWTKITNGIPADDFTRVIRADPTRRGLLYAGTETGIYVSADDGANWLRLGGNLPVVPIHDLAIKDNDLVVATHGRSFWILDDLTLLQQMVDARNEEGIQLFKPRDTYRLSKLPGFGHEPIVGRNYVLAAGMITSYNLTETPDGTKKRSYLDAGANPSDGVVICYRLQEQPQEKISLTFLDAQGQEIKTFYSRPPSEPKPKEGEEKPEDKEPKIPAQAGFNRFVWDMGYSEAMKVITGSGDKDANTAPRAVPGAYQVRLTVGDQHFTQSFAILRDPRIITTDAEFAAQFELHLQIRDKLSQAHAAINQIRSIRAQIEHWVNHTAKTAHSQKIGEAAQQVQDSLAAIEGKLIQVKAQSMQDTLNFPAMLNSKLAFLGWIVGSSDNAPTQAAYDLFSDLAAQVDDQREQLRQVISDQVAAFNTLVKEATLPAVLLPDE